MAIFTFDLCKRIEDQSASSIQSEAADDDVIFGAGPIGQADGAVEFSDAATKQVVLTGNGKLDTSYSITVSMNVYLQDTGPIINWGDEVGFGFFYEAPSKLSFR